MGREDGPPTEATRGHSKESARSSPGPGTANGSPEGRYACETRAESHCNTTARALIRENRTQYTVPLFIRTMQLMRMHGLAKYIIPHPHAPVASSVNFTATTAASTRSQVVAPPSQHSTSAQQLFLQYAGDSVLAGFALGHTKFMQEARTLAEPAMDPSSAMPSAWSRRPTSVDRDCSQREVICMT